MTLLLIAALFLPLFPLSIVLNAVLTRVRHPAARAALLLAWPQIGVSLLLAAGQEIPQWLVAWALASSGFYALRLLTVRDLTLWAGFLASSALALTWGLVGAGALELRLFALWFSLPAALLALLGGPLASRFGAAYAGLHGGLAQLLPRLSGVLVAVVLSAIATPPFPGFFLMLELLSGLAWTAMPAVLAIWLAWGWAATKLLQGFVFGPSSRGASHAAASDLGQASAWAYSAALAVFAITGLYLSGGGL